MTHAHTIRRRLLPALVLTLAVTLAACGGSGSLSRADFVKRADAICRDGQGSFRSIQAAAPANGREAAAQTAKLIANSEDTVRRLRALNPPSSLRAPFDAYLKARNEAINVLRKGQAAAKRNDPQGYAAAKQEIAAGQPKRYDLAKKAGLAACSKPEVRAPGKMGR